MNSKLAINTIKESCYQVGYPHDAGYERRKLINQSCDHAIECIDKLDKIKQILADYDGSMPSMIKQFSDIQKILDKE